MAFLYSGQLMCHALTRETLPNILCEIMLHPHFASATYRRFSTGLHLVNKAPFDRSRCHDKIIQYV